MTALLRRLGAYLLEPRRPARRLAAPSLDRRVPRVPPGPPLLGAARPPVAGAAAAAARGRPRRARRRARRSRPRARASCARGPARRPRSSASGGRPRARRAGDERRRRRRRRARRRPRARRLAAALEAHDLAATACGRLAWLALARRPGRAPSPRSGALLARWPRSRSSSPSPARAPRRFEPVLADADLALAVLPADAEAPLRELALAPLPGRRRDRRPAAARPAALGGAGRARPPALAPGRAVRGPSGRRRP